MSPNKRARYALLASIGCERSAFYAFLAVYVLYRVLRGDSEDAAKAAVGFALAWVYGATFIGGGLGQWIGFEKAAPIGLGLLIGAYTLLGMGTPNNIWMPLLALGIGIYKPAPPILMGKLHAGLHPHVQDAAMLVLYVAINIGGFGGPMIAGFFGENYSWVFYVCALMCFISLIFMFFGWRNFDNENENEELAITLALGGIAKNYGTRPAIPIFIICAFGLIFFAGYNAFFSSVTLWLRNNVNKIVLGSEIPIPWFSAENGLIVLAVGLIWPKFLSKWRISSRLLLALVGSVITYVILVSLQSTFAVPAIVAGVIVATETIAEMSISPLGLSRISALAPPQHVGWYTALWFLANACGGLLSGWLPFRGLLVLLTIGLIGAVVVKRIGVVDSIPKVKTPEPAMPPISQTVS